MHPELASTLGADRFLGEVEYAARLSHPHILPMYASGEVGGDCPGATALVTGRPYMYRSSSTEPRL